MIALAKLCYGLFYAQKLAQECSQKAQMVKNLPAMQETQVQSLGPEDLLEKGMATHSSILAWRIPCTEEPGGLQSRGSQRFRHDWATNTACQDTIKYILVSERQKKWTANDSFG